MTVSGTSDSIIRVDNWDDEINTVEIGGQIIEWREVTRIGDNITFNEEYEETPQGKTYRKDVEFDLPFVNFNTNAALKEFLFTAGGEFAISNALAFIVDDNDQKWIIGYDNPLILQDGMEISIAGENYYRLSFRSISQLRSRNFQIIDY